MMRRRTDKKEMMDIGDDASLLTASECVCVCMCVCVGWLHSCPKRRVEEREKTSNSKILFPETPCFLKQAESWRLMLECTKYAAAGSKNSGSSNDDE
jgi:hypothetical protein